MASASALEVKPAKLALRAWGVPLVACGVGLALALAWGRAPASSETSPARAAARNERARGSPLVGADAPGDDARDFVGVARDFVGVARDRLDAGSYLYFEVEADDGATRWVATLRTSEARVGERVRVSTYATREGFESRRLARRFERLWFGRVAPVDGRRGNPG
jgi:hypothetical protein